MKRIVTFLTLFIILCSSSLNCEAQNYSFEFLDPSVWSFDSVRVGDDTKLICRARNTREDTVQLVFRKGNAAFLPKFPQGPIAPGETISIEYYFKFTHVGAFRKKLKFQIISKKSEKPSFLVLELRGMVYK